jgi:hypothetical protein
VLIGLARAKFSQRFSATIREDMEVDLLSRLRATVLILSACLISTSCTQDDWMVALTCYDPLSRLTPVTTDLSVNGERISRVGYLSPTALSLGDVIQIGGESTSARPQTARHARTSPTDEISRSSAQLRLISINDGCHVNFEPDIKAAADRAGIELHSAVLGNTELHVAGPIVHTLPDVTDAINKDPDIVAKVRGAAVGHFAVVSGAITGQGVWLRPKQVTFSAVDTFFVGSTYIHVVYSCPGCDWVSKHLSSQEATSLIYLTAIRYEASTARLAVSPAPLTVLQRALR